MKNLINFLIIIFTITQATFSQIVQVRAGSYTTNFPGVDEAGRNSYPSGEPQVSGPATKTRFEIGLNLKCEKPAGILEEIKAANSMCSHKINLNSLDEVNSEVLNWVKVAYEKSI
tara:strand:+ start:308 stop:652 length:345 start_codon:yes stop_codon:yes gene_type:complete